MSEGFRERRLEIDADGTALVSTTAETSLLPTSCILNLPGNLFERPKSRLVFAFSGRISNRVTGPDTFKFRLFFGAVAVFDSGLIPLNIVAKTNVHWALEGELVARAVGTGTLTTLFPKGCRYISENVIGAPAATAGGNGMLLLPFNTAPAVGTGFDNTASQLVDLKGTHSVSNAGNSIQLQAGSLDVYS